MKSKLIITLTALLMLGGISAMAQGSFPKGDINEDGVVNVADIVALANIIMNGEEPSGGTKYYWYAGPDMLTSETVPGSGTVYPMTTTADSQTGWHIIEGEPTSIETGDLANPEKINWVLAVPTALNLTHLSNGDDITDLYDITTVTCADGVQYRVFTQMRATKRIDVTFVKGSSEETKYYWYAGTTIPTAENISTIATGSEISKPDWSEPQSIKATNNTGESAYLYYCFPTEWNIRILDSDKTTEMSLAQEGTFTYGGISYTVQRTGRQISNGNSKDYYATTTSREAKYYWYAGTTLPTANNIASIALGSSNTIEKWDGKEFSITNSGEEATPAYVCTPVDFKVSWKDMNGFTLNLVEVEGSEFTLNGIEYKVQKKGRDLSAGAELTCLGYYTDYWYVGNVEPTAATNPVTELGWTALYSKPEQIKIFKEDPNWNDVQWYLAAPAEWGFETTVNGIQVGGWTKTTITINHVSYNVWTAQSLTDTVNVTLANIDN